jgi:hypothetical protein
VSHAPYTYEIAACLMFQNETFFLKEWIEYHRMIGVEHFYLIDNGSTDNYIDFIKPYIKSGVVELYSYPAIGRDQSEHHEIQCFIYNFVIRQAHGRVKWLAIIDADEFIVPVQQRSLRNILSEYEDYGGLYLNYLMFGTAHLEEIPSNRLIIEALNRSAATAMAFGKSIVRPERVCCCSDPHRMWYLPSYGHVDTKHRSFDWVPPDVADDVLLLHHYYLGDIHHATSNKFPRRSTWSSLTLASYLSDHEWMNAKENRSMQKYAHKLRRRLSTPYRP